MLEQKIEALTVEIIALKDVIAGIIANGGNASAAASDTKADKGAAKTTGKGGKGAATSTKTEEPATPTSVHTLPDLQKVLNDYKEVFGVPKAKKLLPSMGYENSKAVPEDKIDEVYDAVVAAIAAESEGDGEL